MPPLAAKTSKPVVLEEWPVSEERAAERQFLDRGVRGHPLRRLETVGRSECLHAIADLAALENRSMTRIGGLISAVQEGVSKKSGKKYAMVTIEDLTGSAQILLMNENFDRYRSLFTANAALLVTAEVSTGEDRPKLFPQEILRLTDAPKRFTRQVHLRLPAAGLHRARLEEIRALVEVHRGNVPLFLSIRMLSGPVVFLESNEHFSVTPSVEFEDAVNAVCGPATYYAKADTSLPERAPRKWERRNGTGGSDGGE